MGPGSVGAIGRLIQELGKLPGIGPKTAERLTHHLLAAPRADVLALADALRAIKESIRRCAQCSNLTENELCPLCADPRRDAGLDLAEPFARIREAVGEARKLGVTSR